MRIFIGCLITITSFGGLGCTQSKPQATPSSPEILKTAYRQVITVAEAEKRNAVTDPRLGPDPVAFGFIHDQWESFKAKIQPGDELVEFYTPPAYSEMIHGYKGLHIIRKGKVIATLITET